MSKSNDLMFNRCFAFRKIVRKDRFLRIIQIIVDIAAVFATLLELSARHSSAPFFTILLIFVNIIITLLNSNQLGNVVGIILTLIYAFLSVKYNMDIAGVIPILFIRIMRIKSIYVHSKLKKLYGYSTFNYFMIDCELKKDNLLKESVEYNYSDVLENKIVVLESAEMRCPWRIQLLKIICLVTMCASLFCICWGVGEKNNYNSAKNISSLESCYDNMNIRGTLDIVYLNTTYSFQESVNNEYVCKFGNETVIFSVPESYKTDFEKKCIPIDETVNDVYEKDKDLEVEFVGTVREVSSYHGKFLMPDISSIDHNYVPYNEDYYIELIDVDKVYERIVNGLVVFLISFVGLSISYFLIFKNIRNLSNYV